MGIELRLQSAYEILLAGILSQDNHTSSLKKKWYLTYMEKVVKIVHLRDSSTDLAYWLTKTPQERLAAIEILRQHYFKLMGIEPRLQRVCRIIDATQR